MNKYVLFFAVNWPDALLDRNGAEHWPLNYDFAGVFQADSLQGLWNLLNREDRPTARVNRSMCVGDIAVVAEADGTPGEARGQMWIARRIGWEELHFVSDQPTPRVIGVNWPDPLSRVTGAVRILEGQQHGGV
jgi:hypothetical protein